MLPLLLCWLFARVYVVFYCFKLRDGSRWIKFGLLGRCLHCLNCRSLLPKPHQASFVQLFLVLLDSHQALDRFLLVIADVRRHPRKTHILPHLFALLEQWLVDDVLDILGILGVHPHVDLFVGQNDRHPVVHVGQLWSCILGEDDDFVVLSV